MNKIWFYGITSLNIFRLFSINSYPLINTIVNKNIWNEFELSHGRFYFSVENRIENRHKITEIFHKMFHFTVQLVAFEHIKIVKYWDVKWKLMSCFQIGSLVKDAGCDMTLTSVGILWEDQVGRFGGWIFMSPYLSLALSRCQKDGEKDKNQKGMGTYW